MASTYSFDVVSEFEISELDHAVDQAKREMSTRYDFKGTPASLEYADAKRTGLTIEGDSEYQLDAVLDMVRGKLAKRGLSQKIVNTDKKPEQAGMILRWTIPFQQGLDQDKAKSITKLIRDKYPKAKAQIQGEAVRVTSASKDDLQGVMQIIRDADLDFPVNFTNYR